MFNANNDVVKLEKKLKKKFKVQNEGLVFVIMNYHTNSFIVFLLALFLFIHKTMPQQFDWAIYQEERLHDELPQNIRVNHYANLKLHQILRYSASADF